jgi:hypothetical protein
VTANEIAFNPLDQTEIVKAAANLWKELEGTLPSIPWLSNSGQQEAFRATVEAITQAAERLPADTRAKYAIVFWTLTFVYANNTKFRVATNAARRVSGLMKVWAVELTFVNWIGSETPPAAVVAASMARWEDRKWP